MMLSQALQNAGCVTNHSDGDVDLLIVKTAVESARTMTTVLAGDEIALPKENVRGARAWHMKKAKDQLGR